MWFKREPKPAVDKGENGMVNKLRRKKPVILKATRESSERETSTESDKERRRYSDILDVVSIGLYKDSTSVRQFLAIFLIKRRLDDTFLCDKLKIITKQ